MTKPKRVMPKRRLSRRSFDAVVQRIVIRSRRVGRPLSRSQATAAAVGMIEHR